MTTNTVSSISSVPVHTATLPQSDGLIQKEFKNTSLKSPESICIVPPFKPEILERALATPAKLTYRNGHLLSKVEVVTTFWNGVAWNQPPQSDILQGVIQFFNSILSSQLMDQLAEYSVQGQSISHGQQVGAYIVNTSSPLGNQVSDAQLQQLLHSLISNNPTVPQPTPNRLYFLYLPPGVTVVSGNDRSCHQFCGYHSAMQGGIFYAVMPFPCEGGCTGGLSLLNAITSVSSHELCEAITDAVPGQGWYDNANGEIGDICAWQQKQVGNYTVQKEWSNQSNACI